MILTREGKEIVAIYKQDGNEVDEVKDANGRIIYTNTREITGTLPLSFTSRGKTLSDYHISGNTVQDGTPTPDAPVDVVGCGVRTENLLAANNTSATVGTITLSNDNGIITITGISSSEISSSNEEWRKAFAFRLKAGSYYFTGVSFGGVASYLRKVSDNTIISLSNKSFVLSSDTDAYIGFYIYKNSNNNFKLMINVGSTPLNYEPYGYKLPLTVNGTEHPIYLGKVESTRRIKKLVLTGDDTETYVSVYSGDNRFFTYVLDSSGLSILISTHFTGANISSKSTDVGLRIVESKELRIRPENVSGMTVADFKVWLQQQYAAGTPVTIWYVLATPETAVVNEPLMKIGDYADTIAMAQAGVTIPTIRGTNVLDMTSTVKPSEVYIKGKGIRATT